MFQLDEAFTAVIIQVDVFWVVTPCSVAVVYKRFALKTEAVRNSETLVSYHNIIGSTTQKTST
jgi:hypothetical protein